MIKITNANVWGFEGAIRGMRMPYESFDKSDSNYGCMEGLEEKKCKDYEYCPSCPVYGFVIGKADMALAKKLIKGGSEHRKFLRMIHVQAEIRAPRYWWQEAITYSYFKVNPDDLCMNSSSTMHLITKRELTIDDFSLDGSALIGVFDDVVNLINYIIKQYNEETDKAMKEIHFRSIKQLLPEGFMMRCMADTNYECLLNMYRQRKAHRLTEWHEFCEWVESLPYMKEFISATN